jgi:CO/xanthine dehydrogenase FAD-binding subunit
MDLTRIHELTGIRVTETSIRIGAATVFAELSTDPDVARELPAVAAMARRIGAVAIQNRATLGGNLVTASPAADSAPILMALGARLRLARRDGARVVPLDAFYPGYRRTTLAADELVVEIEVPRPAAGTVQRFVKVGTRRAQAISKVCLGAVGRLDAARRITHLRLAAGSVAATPVLLDTVASPLIGRRLDGEVDHAALAALALRATRAAVSPIDDVRSTADYRRETLGRLVVGFLAGLAGITGTDDTARAGTPRRPPSPSSGR